LTIRPIKTDEIPLLEDFLYLAVFVPAGMKPPPRDVVFHPGVYVYIENFGGKDDHCLVAEQNGEVIGAAWSRILAHPGKRGYGNIDPYTPELAISVLPEKRGKSVGTTLITALFHTLAEHHYSRLSLSVQKANPALRLYRRVGFEIVGENEEDYIMVKKLSDCEIDVEKLQNLSSQNFAMDLQRIFSQNKAETAVNPLWIDKGDNAVMRKKAQKDE
jgi:GNAT superfamily N-acetyltransferase